MRMNRCGGSGIVLAAVMAFGGCSPNAPTPGPGPGGGGATLPPNTILQIHTRIAALRVGETEAFTVNLSGSAVMTGPPTMTSSDTSVFVIEGDLIRGVGPGRASLRGVYQNLTSEVPQMVVAIGPTPTGFPSLDAPAVLINEFRTSGPAGARDEFIELRNVSGAGVDFAGWSIAITTASGHRESLGVILAGDSSVGPGCHFLLTGTSGPNAYSSGGIATGDFRWASSFFEDDGSLALIDPQGRTVDQVGMSVGGNYLEGAPLAPLVGRSRERIGDTNSNAVDFRPTVADNPRNRASACQ